VCGLTRYLLRRRRPPESAHAINEPVIVPPHCPVEAELQAMVDEGTTAEDRDPDLDREPERKPALV
jgi:hypothetical protein